MAQVAKHGLGFVFGNVLLQQIGVPIPAEPTLVVAGSLAATGRLSPYGLFAATLVAATFADVSWFLLGRHSGPRLQRLARKLFGSARPTGRRASAVFARWGCKSLVVAKFLPGVSQIVVPMAGATGASFRSFMVYDVIGTVVWSAVPIASGMLFHEQVDDVLAAMSRVALWLTLAFAVVIAGALAWRYTIRSVAAPFPLEPSAPPSLAKETAS
ncbi:MAG TPA: DedA family protein [Polyangia bacterium]|nr:DedA family protein [Polyangia bacterium]